MKDPDLELIAERYKVVSEWGNQQPPQQQQPGIARQIATGYAKSKVPSFGTQNSSLGGLSTMAQTGAKWGAAKTAADVAGGAVKTTGQLAAGTGLKTGLGTVTNPVGTAAGIGQIGAGLMQGSEMNKAVAAGQITPQAAAAELAASAKPKGDRKTKLIKSAVKPARESTDINKMSKVYMEQMVNPNQITAELVQYALSDPAVLEQLLGVVPSLGTHPDIVAAQQQAMMQQQAMQQQQVAAAGVVPGAAPAAGQVAA
jgi:hypothetical protein